jgi:hypothetical protein
VRNLPRKTTPRVVGGKVQRKNRSARTSTIYNTPQTPPVIDRQKPGFGFRHLLLKRDISKFIALLPDWDELSNGLNVIALAPGNSTLFGWHRPGIVGFCAWSRDLWHEVTVSFHEEHQDILDRLGVPFSETDGDYSFVWKFTVATARAFQLLHILLHELGHHHDRMSTRSQRRASRGENYAEQYARQYEHLIFDRYVAAFGLD